MTSLLSPTAAVFVPKSRQRGRAPRSTPAPQSAGTQAGTQEPQAPKPPPYYWRAISPRTRLVYITDHLTADAEISKLRPGPLGFDLEWKPTYRKNQPANPVALVQLANHDTILLLHIIKMSVFPARLKKILEDPYIVKTGVGIQNDGRKLWRDCHVNLRNCAELALLARSADNDRWKGSYKAPLGLARLCEVYEGLSLSKGPVRTSNWELPLDAAQQEYAANDCHVALTLYNRLLAMAAAMELPPNASCYTFDCNYGNLYEPFSLPWRLWIAYNPHYDPGPPPPPKPLKPPKARKAKKAATVPVIETDETTIVDELHSSQSTNDGEEQFGMAVGWCDMREI